MIRVKKSSIIAYLIVLFPVAHLIATGSHGAVSTLFSYYDEIIGCISFVYITLLLFKNKLPTEDHLIYGLMLVLTAFGVLSNILSGVDRKLFPIVVDIVFLWKPIACFLAFKHYARQYGKRIACTLLPWAKFTVVFALLICIAGNIVNLGVVSTKGAFVFFWGNSYQTAWLIIGSLLVISANHIHEKIFVKYLILALVPLYATGATMVWAWMAVEIGMIMILKRQKVFKKRYIILLALVLSAAFYAEVSGYLFSRTGPRARLIQGAIRLAAQEFPFGTGFATYGSEMAARYYSPIYRSFGWEYAWGLGTEYGQYLNDNFFACILAQFGWFGFAFYLYIQMHIYNHINSRFLPRMERATVVTTDIILVASMIGSASAKSVMGVFVFCLLGLVAAEAEKAREENDTESHSLV